MKKICLGHPMILSGQNLRKRLTEWERNAIIEKIGLGFKGGGNMKLLHFYHEGTLRFGAATEGGVVDVAGTIQKTGVRAPASLEELFAGGEEGLLSLDRLLEGECVIVPEFRFAPAVPNPGKIFCVGLNYVDHAREAGMELPQFPVIFSKFSTALAAHGDSIRLPETAKEYDYEAELVVVVGKKVRQAGREEARQAIFGYTAGNDFSARDLQMRTSQWLLGKTQDGFGPIGPYLVPARELDGGNLEIISRVNGDVRQHSNTRNLIFDCAEIVRYLSQYLTLYPGDIIFTGTPSGVMLGYPEDQKHWLAAGDRVEVEIEGIGTLCNTLC